jgi:hypothetical protein
MPEETLEILIMENGKWVLIYPSLPMVKEVIEKIGQCEFDFTPYCG